jgi:hypothetical protein
MIDFHRLKVWAIARSIYRASCILGFESTPKNSLEPYFYDNSSIAFGQNNPLVFSDITLLEINKTPFIIPRLLCLMRSPYRSFCKINRLIKIGRCMRSSTKDVRKLKLLLGAGLEATVTFMNHDPKCMEIIGSEEGRVDFYLQDFPAPLLSLMKKQDGGWQVRDFNFIDGQPKVKMIFKSVEIGILSCQNLLDHKISSALGEYKILGYAPMMEKIGYCAKVTSLQIPLPV